MLKRCFGVLLVICMLFTMTQPIMVTAADDGTLVVGNGTVAAGDTETVIPITVKKTGTVGAISLQFDVVFPEELILTEKPVVGTLFADKGLHQAVFTSPYTISLGNDTATENVTAEGDLFTLNFKVKEGTPAGTYNIEINSDSQDNYNADVDNVVFGVTNGAITVGSPTQGEPEQFTVTFDVNGGTPTIDPVKVDKDATVSAPTATLTKTGFTFDGWFTDANTTTKFDFATPITADTTLYAGWTAVTPEQFTVTFDVNGGTPTIDPVKVNKDATVSAPTATLTKTGFTFDGWFTDANATTKFDFATPITADT
ncbi:MAG: InlB B-repeat-containing protein, partial [Oscillospiraceae bacterium]|nr:InlB B-repeat-containing protein [Oscillospiraceae bacterium]